MRPGTEDGMIYHKKNGMLGALNILINERHLEDAAKHINDAALLESADWGFTRLPAAVFAYAELQEIGLCEITNVHVDEDAAFFECRFECGFLLHAIYGAEQEAAEEGILLSVYAKIVFRGRDYQLSFSDICRFYTPGASNYEEWEYKVPDFPGISTRLDLIPTMSGSESEMERKREAVAAWFLTKYYPAALNTVTQVPIRRIAEGKLHMCFIMDKELSGDFSTLGEVVFETCQLTVRDEMTEIGEPIILRRGSVVIDSNVFWQRGFGSMNFTIAHEVFHWFAHRAHRSLMNHVPKPEDYGHLKWVMEVQAKEFAGRVLMPAYGVRKLYEQYALEFADADGDAYPIIVGRLAQFFGVSKTTVRIRLDQLGLRPYRYQGSAVRRMVDLEEIFALYVEDENFRMILDSGEYVYAGGYVVQNDPAYIDGSEDEGYSLTGYALAHLKECTITFRGKTEYVSDDSVGPGMQSYQKYSLTMDYDVKRSGNRKGKLERDTSFLRAAFERYLSEQEEMTFSKYIYPIVYAADTEHLKPDIMTPEEHALRGDPPDKKNKNVTHRSAWKWSFVDEKYRLITEPQVFEALTLVQRRKFNDLATGKCNTPEVDTVVAICAGYHLTYRQLNEAMAAAGHFFVHDRRHMAYQFLFRFCRDRFEDTDTFNTLLCMLGLKPIGTESRK